MKISGHHALGLSISMLLMKKLLAPLILFSTVLSTSVMGATGSRPSLCEQLTYGFFDLLAPTDHFACAIGQTSETEKTEILARLESYQAENPTSPVPLKNIKKIVNAEYDDDVVWAAAKFATFSGAEIQNFLDQHSVDPAKIPIRNTLLRFIIRTVVYNGAAAAIAQWTLAPIVAPDGGFNFIMDGFPFNDVMFAAVTGGGAGVQALFDSKRNQETVFLKSLQNALLDRALAGGKERFVSMDIASAHYTLLWSRDPDGELRFDIVFWRYREKDRSGGP